VITQLLVLRDLYPICPRNVDLEDIAPLLRSLAGLGKITKVLIKKSHVTLELTTLLLMLKLQPIA
jgi:hypothetical protein